MRLETLLRRYLSQKSSFSPNQEGFSLLFCYNEFEKLLVSAAVGDR